MTLTDWLLIGTNFWLFIILLNIQTGLRNQLKIERRNEERNQAQSNTNTAIMMTLDNIHDAIKDLK